MTIYCYIDGSARPNPGKGGIGIIIRGDGWDYTLSESIPRNRITNNQAEYCALYRALVELMRNGLERHDIQILSDSQMLTEQMVGERQVDKGGQYVDTYLKCRELAKYFTNLRFTHILREENYEANLLASEGVKACPS